MNIYREMDFRKEVIEKLDKLLSSRNREVFPDGMKNEMEHVANRFGDGTFLTREESEARVQAAIIDEKQNPWKQAIIDELVVDCILTKMHESDPKKALSDLIHWNNQIALNPQVSSEAAALVLRGRLEGAKDTNAIQTEYELQHISFEECVQRNERYIADLESQIKVKERD